MVVLDSNTLLDAYKLTGTARAEFFAALRLLGDRLFIPHQVGLEFMRQRAIVIKAGTAFPARFREAAKKLHGEVQSLQEHRRLQGEDVRGIRDAIDAAVEDILRRHADLYDFGVSLESSIENDDLFKEIDQITAGKVGPPFAKPGEMAKIGNQRLKDEVPPGYADREKNSDKALGDFFLWEQTIIEARERKIQVLIVSNDGKEDWIRKEDGRARGPRPELVDEMLDRTGQPFHLVNVKTFLTHAKAHLHAQVSDSTIEEAESVQKQTDQASTDSLLEVVTLESMIHLLSEPERAAVKELILETVGQSRAYRNSDDDPRGPWIFADLTSGSERAQGADFQYPVTSPSGRVFMPSPQRGWKVLQERFLEMDTQGRIYWGKNGDRRPVLKKFLPDVEARFYF
ncbi:hypothetical protein FXF51_02175 [Nonomuraea sp. PA05]|uniref:PIN-like domain-containing protein n=1 Tax=Nonomuraea sp. PA05 TaxID=2604466 RepID=UPI0011D47B3F|nr:PIN-like domain-containing protein [Nonomuraea sp. PA05]TYB71263.1 hypothetical protein FXF51_02175 [Nonomuraea sp. PA05]